MERKGKEAAREFLNTVIAVKGPTLPITPEQPAPSQFQPGSRPSPPVPVSPAVSTEEIRLLLCEGMPLTQAYAQVGLSRIQGSKYVKRLESQGVAKFHRFTTGKQGGALTVLEVTEHGWRILEGLKMKHPSPLTGGGWEHNWAAGLIRRRGMEQGYRVRFEVPLGEVRLDVEWKNSKGDAVYLNIGISDPVREATNAAKAMKLPAVHQSHLILVCRDVDFSRKVQTAFHANSAAEIAKSVEIKLVSDFLS